MKRSFIFIVLLSFSLNMSGQDISADISGAKSAYMSKDYESARSYLQNALIDLDKILAEEILKILPENLGSLQVDPESDSKEGSGTSFGLFVTRVYGTSDADYAEISIVDNSPMIAMVNAFLSSPMLTGLAGQSAGQKVVKVDGYKGMLQKDDDMEGSYSLMVPFGDSMLTLETSIRDESTVMSMAEQIPLGKIAELVQ